MDFQTTLLLCNNAVEYSSARLQSANGFFIDWDVDRKIGEMRDEKARMFPKRPANDQERLNWISATARLALQRGVGNCGEKAAVCFQFLMRRNVFPLDYMAVTDGDHIFVVAGRPKGSDDKDADTWGWDSCIADGWAGLSYRARPVTMAFGLPGYHITNGYKSQFTWNGPTP